MSVEQLLTINETAELLRITRGTVYHLIRTHQLATVRVGKRLRVEPSAIRDLLSGRESTSAELKKDELDGAVTRLSAQEDPHG